MTHLDVLLPVLTPVEPADPRVRFISQVRTLDLDTRASGKPRYARYAVQSAAVQLLKDRTADPSVIQVCRPVVIVHYDAESRLPLPIKRPYQRRIWSVTGPINRGIGYTRPYEAVPGALATTVVPVPKSDYYIVSENAAFLDGDARRYLAVQRSPLTYMDAGHTRVYRWDDGTWTPRSARHKDVRELLHLHRAMFEITT